MRRCRRAALPKGPGVSAHEARNGLAGCPGGDLLTMVDTPNRKERPGDEVPPEAPSSGENICPECHGEGEKDGEPCANCQGTGRVTEAIGGG